MSLFSKNPFEGASKSSPLKMSQYVREAVERKDIDALKRELMAIDRSIDNAVTNQLSARPIVTGNKRRERDFSEELREARDSVQLAIDFVLHGKK